MLQGIFLLIILISSCAGESFSKLSDSFESSNFRLAFYSLSPSVDAATVLVPPGYWKISDDAVTPIKCPMHEACLGAKIGYQSTTSLMSIQSFIQKQ